MSARSAISSVRDLASAEAANLLYTSELEKIQLVCERAIVLFGGHVVDELSAADADEPTLVRAAYGVPGRGTDSGRGHPVSV